MPSKKKKYNARFPAGRIKKIMQTDEEIGKVAQAVPVIISRTLELFVESLLKKAMQITSAKNAKTLTPTHMKQCILSEGRFDFLKDLVKGIPDVSSTDDEFGSLSGGNISPGTPISAKSYSSYSCFQFHQSSDSSSSKNSGATSQSTPSTTITPTVTPQTPTSVSLASQPIFYKEIPIGSDDSENNKNENSTPSSVQGSSVIQHASSQQSLNQQHSSIFPPHKKDGNSSSVVRTISGHNINQLNELKLTNSVKNSGNAKSVSEQVSASEEMEEEEDDDDDDDEEELHVAENGYHMETNIATKTCTIDEDYDT